MRRTLEGTARSGAAALRLLTTAIPPETLAVLVSTRVALTIVGVLAVALLPVAHPTVLNPPTGIPLLDVWTRWDGGFYVEIAASGYRAHPPLPNIVFFPLYPALIRVVAPLVGGGSAGLWVAALAVSLASLAVAVAYLIALVRMELDDRLARRAAMYLMVFPTSLFLTAAYPESLFLALSLAAFYHARRGTWWLAGIVGLAASLTRPYGALLVVPLAFEYLLQRRFDVRLVRLDALWIGLAALGGPLFLGYLAWKFNDAGVMQEAQNYWGRRLVAPWDALARYFDAPIIVHGFPTQGRSLVDLAFVAVFVTLVVMGWRRLRPTYAIHATLLLAAILSSSAFTSVPRYGLALFPAFMSLALWADDTPRHAVIVNMSLILAGLAMALFASVRWLA
jgi:hypothetical protein